MCLPHFGIKFNFSNPETKCRQQLSGASLIQQTPVKTNAKGLKNVSVLSEIRLKRTFSFFFFFSLWALQESKSVLRLKHRLRLNRNLLSVTAGNTVGGVARCCAALFRLTSLCLMCHLSMKFFNIVLASLPHLFPSFNLILTLVLTASSVRSHLKVLTAFAVQARYPTVAHASIQIAQPRPASQMSSVQQCSKYPGMTRESPFRRSVAAQCAGSADLAGCLRQR